jgi:hypothetical protein
MPVTALCSRALVLALIGVAGAAFSARAVEEDTFAARVAAAELHGAAGETEKALRQLDAMVVEAMQAGLPDAQVIVGQALVRVKLHAGRIDAARREMETTLATARQFGLLQFEASLSETFAEVWLAAGDSDNAALWLERSYQFALGQNPPQTELARDALTRLAMLWRSMNQEPLAAQADAWLGLLDGNPAAPPSGVELQPVVTHTQVASDEVGRTRLVLANASPATATGTLLLDPGELFVKEWKSHADGEWVVLSSSGKSGILPAGLSQGRKLTIRPGEQRFVNVELEPAIPPRFTKSSISFTWQSGPTTSTSRLYFHFVDAADLRDPSVANASEVRLSPYLSIPVYEEIYYRGSDAQRIESFLPATSAPCRVEIYELSRSAGSESRVLLAVDADGDGRFDGAGDAVYSDHDRDSFPDVLFTAQKSVAALELRLYPLADPKDGIAPNLDLTISLADGADWRQPPDAVNRIRVR